MKTRTRRHVCVAGLALAALAMILSMGPLPPAAASPDSVDVLQLVERAEQAYWNAWPPIVGSITLGAEYVPPLAWDGADPEEPAFVPVTVSVAGSAFDVDWWWYNFFGGIWTYMPWIDLLSMLTLDASEGFTVTEPWAGSSIAGVYSTLNRAEQTEALYEVEFELHADDDPVFADDSPLTVLETLSVVLPNAATTQWYQHLSSAGVHVGDTFRHSVFYQPDDVSPNDPAPFVSFNRCTVQEGEFSLLSYEGFHEDDVLGWFLNEIATKDCDVMIEGNQFLDQNWINRWQTASVYGNTFKESGVIRIRQGWRTIHPNTGPWWHHTIEFHFAGQATSEPGACFVRKMGYQYTSTEQEWVSCPLLP